MPEAQKTSGSTKNKRPEQFAHLHLHSQYSLLDGGNRLDRLVKRIKELGMESVAVTDHGNMFGAVDFYRRAKAEGLKPILGIEAYVAPEDRKKKEYTGVADGGHHLVLLAENETGYRNLLKLTSDSFIEGFYYKPRMDKSTLAQWPDGIIAINGHLGSSIAFYLRKFVETKDNKYYELAKEEAVWHAETFKPSESGDPRFYMELQVHDVQDQRDINPFIIKIAKELDLPLVVDNDAHYLLKEDWDAHDVLCCISMGKIRDDENRLRYSKDLYVTSINEMWDMLANDPNNGVAPEEAYEAFENTNRIAERCNVDIDFSGNFAPVVRIETDFSGLPTDAEGALELLDAFESEHKAGSNEWYAHVRSSISVHPFDAEKDTQSEDELKVQCDGALRILTEAGAIWRYGRDGVDEARRARMERELKVLKDKIISAYFIIVWDFVNEARRRNIPVLARGSGVGTMTGFCLGLSNACPVEYGLLFERFTDPDRTEYPDIDIDMCQDGRQDLIDFVRQKYGYVAQIITFNVLKAKAAIRDVGRVLDVPLSEVDTTCKLIGEQLGVTIEKALDQEPDLKKLYDSSPMHRELIDMSRRLEGMARHAGVHAAGVIVATQPLENIVPLYKPPGQKDDGPQQIVTQWDGPTCESVGLLKMDFLGLRTLSIITRAQELIQETLIEETVLGTINAGREQAGVDPCAEDPLDLERLAFDDPNVFKLFARGETGGVFQFESDGMRNLLMDMRPDRLGDLIAANALYRPGPMELIPNYNNRKHGREDVPEAHEIVKKFTDETQGIMIYQEQIMQIVHELGSIPLRQAYTLIKAISKKKEKTINEARAQFIVGSGEKGVSEKDANDLFDLILKFAGYGFNKSHSTGYAIVAYQTAYLKTYFPLQYMCAVLTYEAVSTEKVVEYIDGVKHIKLPNGQVGLDVRPPDINLSGLGFTPVYNGELKDRRTRRTASDGYIRFGLTAVKGVGTKAIDAILDERKKKGPYKSLYDFCERVNLRAVNRACIEALVKCGAFDEVHGGMEQRAAMCEALESAINAGQRANADRAAGQMSMFGGFAAADTAAGTGPAEDQLPMVAAWDIKECLKYEKEVLGFYVSSHPLDEVAEEVGRFTTCTIEQATRVNDETNVIVAGMLSRVRPVFTKAKGDKMAMITIEDTNASIDGVTFPRTYALVASELRVDNIVLLKGKVDRKRGQPQILVDDVIPIHEAPKKLTQEVRIVVTDPTPQDNGTGFNGEFNDLKRVLRQSAQITDDTCNPANVVLELRQEGFAVCVRLDSMRVVADEMLVSSVKTILNGSCQCKLIGPSKINLDDDEVKHDGIHRGDQLGPSSAMEAGPSASIARY